MLTVCDETVRKRIQLHRVQSEFRKSRALYRGYVGGRGAGKSWAGAYDLIRRAKRGRTYLVGSPTGVLMQDTTFPTFKNLAQDMNVWGSVKLTPYPNVELTTGATIRFRTAEDPERMRGPNLSGVWLDEASLMPREAYDICIAALRECGEQGWLSATFTPKGIYHWTYDVFGKETPNTALFRARTGDNPFNPRGFEETLAGQYTPQYARQELGGEFLNIEGAEFPSEWFPDSMWFDEWPAGINLSTVGLDPSKGARNREATKKRHGDYSALVALCRDRSGLCWIEADMDYVRDVTKIVSDGIAFAQRIERETGHALDGFGVESDFLMLLAHEFRVQSATAGLMLPIFEMTTEGVDKNSRIRRLTAPLKSGQFRFRDTPGTRLLVRQLQEFPVGEYDDGADSLEYSRRLAIEISHGINRSGSQPRRVAAR